MTSDLGYLFLIIDNILRTKKSVSQWIIQLVCTVMNVMLIKSREVDILQLDVRLIMLLTHHVGSFVEILLWGRCILIIGVDLWRIDKLVGWSVRNHFDF